VPARGGGTIIDKAEHLLLAEEDWLEKHKHCFQAGSKEGSGTSSGGQLKGKQPTRSDGGASGTVKLTYEGMPRQKGCCRNWGIYGHWVQDCKPQRRRRRRPSSQRRTWLWAARSSRH
jgi:hypothetical protein